MSDRHQQLVGGSCGLFVGLITLDFVYLAPSPPTNNQKIVASDYSVSAGGPATIVSQGTGERAVVSINAVKNQVTPESIPENILQGIDIVLIDGHQMVVGEAIAQLAKARNIPIVVDAGSWKLGFEKVLLFADYAICSANFHPPDCHSTTEVFKYLSQMGISQIAITQGEKPIKFLTEGRIQSLEVPQIEAVDTLGAGDIFHGAFCHYILQESFTDALASAAKVAAQACQHFGSRHWMQRG